ncbi:MAG: CinA family protein [Bacteroidota bacterium]
MEPYIIPALTVEKAEQLISLCREQSLWISLAESCTGGMLAMLLTAIPGSSATLDRSLVTYSNEAKMELLDVRETTLMRHGAVSEETVREMLSGIFLHTKADLAVAISGIAGPGGGTPEKPVGMVYLGWGRREAEQHVVAYHFLETRREVRIKSCEQALDNLLELIG